MILIVFKSLSSNPIGYEKPESVQLANNFELMMIDQYPVWCRSDWIALKKGKHFSLPSKKSLIQKQTFMQL